MDGKLLTVLSRDQDFREPELAEQWLVPKGCKTGSENRIGILALRPWMGAAWSNLVSAGTGQVLNSQQSPGEQEPFYGSSSTSCSN